MPDPPEDPLSLPNGVLAILADHEDAAREAGLKPYLMRRSVETAVEAYRRAVVSGDAKSIAAAEETMLQRSTRCAEQLAQGAVRLLQGIIDRG